MRNRVTRRSGLLVLALGAVAGAVLGRRLLQRGGERADLYFENGSMISLDSDAPAARGLFPIARDMLAATGG